METQASIVNKSVPSSPNLVTGSSARRNLGKSHLGGVIFGCKNNTIKECLSKQLFGLPILHFSYVKNIDPGLPLFLFNYSDRKLHGIFEAASPGQMNINPHGWTTEGSERTKYPAQVQIRIRMHYQPLLENQFKPIIIDNYYSHTHFWFELDRAQTNRLMSLFASLVDAPSSCLPHNSAKWRTIFQPLPRNNAGEEGEELNPLALEIKHSNPSSQKSDSTDVASSFDVDSPILEAQLDAELAELDEIKVILTKLKELALCHEHQDLPVSGYMEDVAFMNGIQLEDKGFQGMPTGVEENKEDNPHSSFGVHEKNEENPHPPSYVEEKKGGNPHSSSECWSTITQLIREVQELKAFNAGQTQKFGVLEQKLVVAEMEIQRLKDHCAILEPLSNPSVAFVNEMIIDGLDEVHLDPNESIFLIGGYDGESWLSAVNLYDPSQDVIKSLRPMNSVRSFSSAAQLKGELYVFGGGNGNVWYDTVESYSPANDQWTLHTPLNQEKGSLAGATIDNKIFAIGGGNGTKSFSDVEMLDLEIGRWISTRSMLQRRFALAAVELSGVLYATGGFDGKNYLESAERFDPREHSWTRIASMNTKRSSHSLVVFNEKLYALGGYDGTTMVPSIEIFDPRNGSWMFGEPMKNPRGYSAAGVIKDSIYVIGGIKGCGNIVDTVETYKDGQGWQETHTRAVGKRCFTSAIAFSPDTAGRYL
ncbi:uncharacterized protein LOC121265327 isoform X2 [Juglans microcarpa x Juglans regia]|uniref:uncharacterized protein LOC121265327 isoform X2 n=1 Tax=Juglans microcarpa x Juglans regia TaxID=2249226 RepID=UPI001B7F44D9|nr:uncharacterized protein LOC121265327 isoform X2 [Juglans microcarpa x Juglans regia]XP_041024851.1 uncharacterized protein LOC121265327 isoform X2 [Juglans microcarpa x Juglans regia]